MPTGEWLPLFRHVGDPKIQRLAELTGDDPFAVLGRVAEWFRYVQLHLDCSRSGITAASFYRVIGWRPLSRKCRERGLVDYLPAMCHPDVCWLEVDDTGVLIVKDFEKNFGKALRRRCQENQRKQAWRAQEAGFGHAGVTLGAGQNADQTRSKRDETEDEKVSIFDENRPASVRGSISAGHQGVQNTTLAKLLELMSVPRVDPGDKTPRGKQTRSDHSTFQAIIEGVVTSPDGEEARLQGEGLLALAKSVAASRGVRNPSAVFTARAAREFPGVHSVKEGSADGAH